jgi:hypothetical protein
MLSLRIFILNGKIKQEYQDILLMEEEIRKDVMIIVLNAKNDFAFPTSPTKNSPR